jgi:hypothetical protein
MPASRHSSSTALSTDVLRWVLWRGGAVLATMVSTVPQPPLCIAAGCGGTGLATAGEGEGDGAAVSGLSMLLSAASAQVSPTGSSSSSGALGGASGLLTSASGSVPMEKSRRALVLLPPLLLGLTSRAACFGGLDGLPRWLLMRSQEASPPSGAASAATFKQGCSRAEFKLHSSTEIARRCKIAGKGCRVLSAYQRCVALHCYWEAAWEL